ncbi:MAG: T9SS type A sorting domain-containing protein [Bacteroidota bacterium]
MTSRLFSQIGTSPSNPYVVYPAANCNNTCGQQFCGNMQCPTGNCSSSVTAAGNSSGFDPACSSDDERSQSVIWVRVYATTTSFTINNGSPYVGPGASNANARDYAVYSGLPGNLSQINCGYLAAGASATIGGLITGRNYYVMVSPPASNPTANATSVCFTSSVPYLPSGNTCSSAVPLTTNVTYTMTNAGATPNAPICSGSVENDVWYSWCTPANWPIGQKAYISVYNQICNSTQGLQLSVWNTGSTCPTAATNPTVICQNPGVTTPYYYEWIPNPNQCYLITIDGFAGTACEFRLTVGSIIILPVELMSFNVTDINGVAEVKWVTASETNNEQFAVERSRNGRDFENVTTLPGAGTTSELRSYRFIDHFPLSGVSYYRIKQSDFDGKSSYSEVVSYRNIDDGKIIRLVPNPAENHVTVVIPDGLDASSVSVQDVRGQVVVQKDLASDRLTDMDVSGLSKGMYFVKVVGGSSISTEQLVLR